MIFAAPLLSGNRLSRADRQKSLQNDAARYFTDFGSTVSLDKGGKS